MSRTAPDEVEQAQLKLICPKCHSGRGVWCHSDAYGRETEYTRRLHAKRFWMAHAYEYLPLEADPLVSRDGPREGAQGQPRTS